MFCPKCATENPAAGKFCRKCGIDISGVSGALEKNSIENRSVGGSGYLDPTGLSARADIDLKNRKDPADLWGAGIRNTIFGGGFLVISLVLFLTNVAKGQRWWWALLFPGFSMIARGVSNMMKANRLEERMIGQNAVIHAESQPRSESRKTLSATKTEYVSPESPSYNTGKLTPTSVVENTTRLLEIESDGKTMILDDKE